MKTAEEWQVKIGYYRDTPDFAVFVHDVQAIQADALRHAAAVVRTHEFPMNIEDWQNLTKKDVSAVACISAAEKLLNEADKIEGKSDQPKVHYLKSHPEPFRAVRSGKKKHEFRKNDRDFKAGDVLCLQEFRPEEDAMTGDQFFVSVTWLSLGPEWGIPDGYCVMSVEEVDPMKAPRGYAAGAGGHTKGKGMT